MIQAIMKDGKKRRFVGGIPKEFVSEIAYMKELTEDEILKVPEVKDGKIEMREHNAEEKAAQKAIEDEAKAKAAKAKMIDLQMKIDAAKKLNLDVTEEEIELNKLKGK